MDGMSEISGGIKRNKFIDREMMDRLTDIRMEGWMDK